MNEAKTAQSGSGADKKTIFAKLEIRPVINACGIYTDLGGSLLAPQIWDDLTQLNESYVDLVELLARTGERIADLVGAEAARITPGASAALALGVAACMAGDHKPHWEQLPDTEGMADSLLIQHNHLAAYKYIGPVRLTGAQVVPVGTARGTTLGNIVAAIDARTAAILVPAHLDRTGNTVGLEELIESARDRQVPVVVDAAYQNDPPSSMRRFAQMGADLTCFSAKYLGGPNAGGFISGRAALIDIVTGLDFTRFEAQPYRTFGRPFKMGSHEIAATALALERWFAVDHGQRIARHAQVASILADGLASLPVPAQLGHFTLDERFVTDRPPNAVALEFSEPDFQAEELANALASGWPSIRAIAGEDRLIFVAETMTGDDAELVAERIGGWFAAAKAGADD